MVYIYIIVYNTLACNMKPWRMSCNVVETPGLNEPARYNNPRFWLSSGLLYHIIPELIKITKTSISRARGAHAYWSWRSRDAMSRDAARTWPYSISVSRDMTCTVYNSLRARCSMWNSQTGDCATVWLLLYYCLSLWLSELVSGLFLIWHCISMCSLFGCQIDWLYNQQCTRTNVHCTLPE